MVMNTYAFVLDLERSGAVPGGGCRTSLTVLTGRWLLSKRALVIR
jgi:hypothetical protein